MKTTLKQSQIIENSQKICYPKEKLKAPDADICILKSHEKRKYTNTKNTYTGDILKRQEAIIMMTLAAEKRDPEVKAKKLRREGYTTGVLYGREMKENVTLKYAEKDALNFIKKAKEGAQTMLDISGEKVDALVKNIDYDPLSKKILALDFQALVAGEVVAATVPVTFVNEEVVQGVFEPEITEIHYKADPAHLLDPIEIDLAKLPQGTRTLYVKDLKLEEKGVTVTTTADSQLFHIGEYTKAEEEDEKAEETPAK